MNFSSLSFNELHNEGVKYSKALKKCETYIIEILGMINEKKIYLKFNEANIYSYAEKYYDFSYKKVYSFIEIYKSSKEVPELKKEIKEANIPYSKLSTILPAIKKLNNEKKVFQNEGSIQNKEKIQIRNSQIKNLLSLSKTTSRRKLELVSRDIAPIHSSQLKSPEPRYLGNNTVECTLRVSKEEYVLLEKAWQLLNEESPKEKVTLQKAVVLMSERLISGKLKKGNKKAAIIVDKNTETKKEQVTTIRFSELEIDKKKMETGWNAYCQVDKERRKAKKLSNFVKNDVYKRDEGKCACCKSTQSLQFHHLKHKYEGGTDEIENIVLICKSCHSLYHQGYLLLNKSLDGSLKHTFKNRNISSYTNYVFNKKRDASLNIKSYKNLQNQTGQRLLF